MSKQKYIEINGVEFELVKGSIDTVGEWQKVFSRSHRYDNIFKAYNKPSARKVAIWNGWKEWADAMPCKLWIESRSCNFFTIGGFTEWNNKRYWLRITRCHNYAREVLR